MSPIEAAVAPLKEEAVERAKQFAQRTINNVRANMDAAGWDLNVAAPRPHPRMSRRDYNMRMATHNLYRSLTEPTKPYLRAGDSNIRTSDPVAEIRFIDDAAKDAASQYDSFVNKLVQKIGAVKYASLTGSHVWGYSILTVTKDCPSLTVERWKTQQITNVSSLGKVFNQWPTRKVK